MSSAAHEHLNRAREFLNVGQSNLEHEYCSQSISASYYACYHAAKGLMVERQIERSSRSGIWAAFGEHVARPRLLNPELHRIALNLFEARQLSDYEANPGDTEEGAARALKDASEFVKGILAYFRETL